MPTAIVVDTMIASASLGVRDSPRKARWAPLLSASPWVLPFTVVAEDAIFEGLLNLRRAAATDG